MPEGAADLALIGQISGTKMKNDGKRRGRVGRRNHWSGHFPTIVAGNRSGPQGAFNPRDAGSNPARPTGRFRSSEGLFALPGREANHRGPTLAPHWPRIRHEPARGASLPTPSTRTNESRRALPKARQHLWQGLMPVGVLAPYGLLTRERRMCPIGAIRTDALGPPVRSRLPSLPALVQGTSLARPSRSSRKRSMRPQPPRP